MPEVHDLDQYVPCEIIYYDKISHEIISKGCDIAKHNKEKLKKYIYFSSQ